MVSSGEDSCAHDAQPSNIPPVMADTYTYFIIFARFDVSLQSSVLNCNQLESNLQTIEVVTF